jgi:hypothetical protein
MTEYVEALQRQNDPLVAALQQIQQQQQQVQVPDYVMGQRLDAPTLQQSEADTAAKVNTMLQGRPDYAQYMQGVPEPTWRQRFSMGVERGLLRGGLLPRIIGAAMAAGQTPKEKAEERYATDYGVWKRGLDDQSGALDYVAKQQQTAMAPLNYAVDQANLTERQNYNRYLADKRADELKQPTKTQEYDQLIAYWKSKYPQLTDEQIIEIATGKDIRLPSPADKSYDDIPEEVQAKWDAENPGKWDWTPSGYDEKTGKRRYKATLKKAEKEKERPLKNVPDAEVERAMMLGSKMAEDEMAIRLGEKHTPKTEQPAGKAESSESAMRLKIQDMIRRGMTNEQIQQAISK